MPISSPQIIEAAEPLRSAAGWQPLCAGVGPVNVRLVNGVFGDPLLEIEFRNRPGRLLFDLGDATSLSRRVLHSVTDVFITHAHFDHVCGFLHLLRARMTGEYPPCRIFGPPGTAAHIDSFIAGIHWDRIEDAGPEFLVADVHPGHINWSHLKAGHAAAQLQPQPTMDGVISQHSDYQVRCIELDHGIPVLAFALELKPELHIDRTRLDAMGLEPGPWIRALKQRIRDGDLEALIRLSDDRTETVAALRDALVTTTPGRKMVYATDFADTGSNRTALRDLAADANLLFCEATFCEADVDQARCTQHLTTRACSEIARSAGVDRLVPFHFSKRYTDRVMSVYQEIQAALT